MKEFLKLTAETAKNANQPDSADYMKDGLLHCCKCNTPKQCRVNLFDEMHIVSCMCACENQKYESEIRSRKEQEAQEHKERLRSVCFSTSKKFYHASFENDNHEGDPKIMQIFREYTEHFQEALEKNHGLLIFGNVGTGKSYAAACICNAVIDRGYSAHFTTFSQIKNALWNADKHEYMAEIAGYDLLVLDDYGAESDTAYTDEIVISVLDTRANSGKPMIVTTNLTQAELSDTENIRKERALSRIIGNCIPVRYVGDDRRKKNKSEQAEFFRKLKENML